MHFTCQNFEVHSTLYGNTATCKAVVIIPSIMLDLLYYFLRLQLKQTIHMKIQYIMKVSDDLSLFHQNINNHATQQTLYMSSLIIQLKYKQQVEPFIVGGELFHGRPSPGLASPPPSCRYRGPISFVFLIIFPSISPNSYKLNVRIRVLSHVELRRHHVSSNDVIHIISGTFLPLRPSIQQFSLLLRLLRRMRVIQQSPIS